MFNVLKARFTQGYRTGRFPDAPPSLPDRFLGMPCVEQEKCNTSCDACMKACPVSAISRLPDGRLSLDTGKCIFCGACAKACKDGALSFSKEHRLSRFERGALLADSPLKEPPAQTDARFKSLFGRSLKIRQVSAGGCNACELDFNVLNTLAWDMGRFGIQAVASPRHADCLLVTGPVSKNMLLALEKTYKALPPPRHVIACGACAISGGVYAGSSEQRCGVEGILKVDLYIPGCPPHPATILDGLLRLMGRIQ